MWKLIGHDVPTPAAADDVRRGDGAASAPTSPTCAWARSSSSAPSFFSDTTFRVFQAPYVGAVVMPGGAGQPRKQLDAWQEWAKQRGAKGLAYVLVAGGRRARADRSPRTSPTPSVPASPPTSAPRPVTASSSPPDRPRRAAPCSAPHASRSAAAAGCSTRTPGSLHCGSSTPRCSSPPPMPPPRGDVAVGCSAWTAVHHAFTVPEAESADTFDTDPGRRPGLRLRHRLQRQRDRRGIHPYPPRGRPEARLRRHGARRGRGRREVRLPARGVQVRRPAARRHRGRHGTASCALLAGTDSIRDVIAFPKSGGGYDPLTAAPAPISPGPAQGGRRRRQAGGGCVASRPDPRAILRRSGHGGRVRIVTRQ